MRRGTTPTLEFTLPFESDAIENLVITFAYYGQIYFEKKLADCTLVGKIIKVSLTQEDTLALKGNVVHIQLKCKTKDNKVLASDVIQANVFEILNEDIL